MGKLLSNYDTHLAEQIVSGIAANTFVYYVFASHPYPWTDEAIPPVDDDAVTGSVVESHDTMLFGKRVTNNDVRYLVSRYNWQTNTVYTQYSNIDGSLQGKNFYVITE